MRLIIITGMGGSGVSTVAHHSALQCAARGRRVALLDVSGGPPPPGPLFEAERLDPGRELGRLPGLSGWLAALGRRGDKPGLAHQGGLAIPGVVEILELCAIERALSGGRYDVVVVDAPPLSAAHRLMSLPALATRLGWEQRRRTGSTLARILARHLIDAPLPDGEALEELGQHLDQLTRLFGSLHDPEVSSVRVVLRPGALNTAATRALLAPLALSGLPLDGAYAGVARALRPDEQELLVAAAVPLPLMQGAPRPACDVEAVWYRPPAPRVMRRDDGYRFLIPLPFQSRDALTLRQDGDRVVIASGISAREVQLPAPLAGSICSGAAYDGTTLTLAFRGPGMASS